MVKEATGLCVQHCNRGQVFPIQFKVKDVDILHHSFLANGFGQRNNAVSMMKEMLRTILLKQETVKKIRKDVKAVLWKPSGGLGHCLHNLAWAYKFCVMKS